MSTSPPKHNFSATAVKISGGLNKSLNMVNSIEKKVKNSNDILKNSDNISKQLTNLKKELNAIEKGITASREQFKKNASPSLKKLNNIPAKASYAKHVEKAGIFRSGLKVKSVPPIRNMNNMIREIEKDAKAGNAAKKLAKIKNNLEKSRTRISEATVKISGTRNRNNKVNGTRNRNNNSNLNRELNKANMENRSRQLANLLNPLVENTKKSIRKTEKR